MVRAKSLVAALLLSASAALPAAAQLTIGAPSSGGNCFPFGCNSGTVYQQIYSAGSFSGPLSIGAIAFITQTGGATNTGTFTFYLSTTTLGLNVGGAGGISNSNFNGNRGADNALFGTLTLTGQTLGVGDRISVVGSPFMYDPANGNLLLDIRSNITASGSSFFEARNGDAGGLFSRAHDFGGGNDNFGLVTEFSTSTVPEPGSVALVGAGLLALLATGARRRKRQA